MSFNRDSILSKDSVETRSVLFKTRTSAKATLGWSVGLSAMFGSVIGFFVLMIFVLSGRPQAGLPLLNGGAILGYLFGALLFAGDLGL